MCLVWAHTNCLIHIISIPASLLSSLLNWFPCQGLKSPLYFPFLICFSFFILSCYLAKEQFYLNWEREKYFQTIFYSVPFPSGKCFFLLMQIWTLLVWNILVVLRSCYGIYSQAPLEPFQKNKGLCFASYKLRSPRGQVIIWPTSDSSVGLEASNYIWSYTPELPLADKWNPVTLTLTNACPGWLLYSANCLTAKPT